MISTCGGKHLVPDAIPTIFISDGTDGNIQENESPSSSMCSSCSHCFELETKLTNLEKLIQKKELDHNIEIQSFQQKLNEMKEIKAAMTIDINILQKKLSQKEQKNNKLEQTIQNIKHKRYFSNAITNVCNGPLIMLRYAFILIQVSFFL